jgi:hypothetical protein
MLVVAGWLCQAGFRAWLSRGQLVPLANPDESAYLIAARVLADGTGGDFAQSTLYPAGYPLLITPVFWFTHNPVTAYRAVLMINAAISALLMPLAFVAGRRLELSRPLAYAVAMITALLPAGLFYSEYALADAIFPVLVLAWLLATHSWLTAPGARGKYWAATGAALLTGYSYAVHSRGLVIIAGFVAVGAVVSWYRLVPRGTLAAAGLALLTTVLAGWALDKHIAAIMYPGGARSLSGVAATRLHSVHGVILVLEMAAGQMWRLTLDSWGIAAVGLVATLVVMVRRNTGADVRIMAALSVGVTIAIAVTTPAALPANQGQVWASGRYLDCMIVTFFLPGMVVLLKGHRRQILACAGAVVPPTVVAGITVDAYAGTSLPASTFGTAFNFAEPAFLTQDWVQANVALATLVALALLVLWVVVVLFVPGGRLLVLAGLAAISLAAVLQMTSEVSRAYTPAAVTSTAGLITSGDLKPGEQLAVSTTLSWEISIPQAYEIWWTQEESFNQATQPPPADATIVEVPWPASGPAQDSWPQAPHGWQIVTYDPAVGLTPGWVAWRAPGS